MFKNAMNCGKITRFVAARAVQKNSVKCSTQVWLKFKAKGKVWVLGLSYLVCNVLCLNIPHTDL
jgi:hypothetical protein